MGARERLAELIAASGMTQAEVARRVGEPTTWVNNRLRAVADIKADDVPRLARALGVPTSAFFEPASEPGSSTERALRGNPAFMERLSSALLRSLADLPSDDRAQLWSLAGRLSEERDQPAEGERGSVKKAIAERTTRYLARMWEDLPADEQEFIWEMIEARKRLHERDAKP